MANLFPETEPPVESPEAESGTVKFGRSWRFDFAVGDFARTPAGKVAECDGTDAWLEWCKKTLQTQRYHYPVYSRDYGQEFDSLIGQALTRSALESEITRMTTEALMTDPRTAGVTAFRFQWEGERCLFTCEVSSVLEESATIEGSVVNA